MSGISSIGLKGESEFFRRHNNRLLSKQKKIKSIKLKGFHLVLMTWEKFKVKSFKLVNSPGLETKELKKILTGYSTNIFSLNMAELKKELLTLREVKDVTLSRKLPATIEIGFFLREPVFQVLISKKGGGKFDLVDEEGIVLLTGAVRQKNLVTIKSNRRDDWNKILPYLAELDRLRHVIDYVSIEEPYGIALKLKGIGEIFYPGESDFAYKINYYLKLKRMPLLRKYRVKHVDLRFKDRFYLEYENDKEVNS